MVFVIKIHLNIVSSIRSELYEKLSTVEIWIAYLVPQYHFICETEQCENVHSAVIGINATKFT